MKFFIVDYKFDSDPVKTKLFDYEDDQQSAELFCKRIKEKGGVVNIRIRDIKIPD